MSCTFLIAISLVLFTTISDANESSTIYVIRHGEKTWSMGCLSEKGKARANALPHIFSGDAFQVPSHLFANKYDNPVGCERCLQTLQPISHHLGLDINHSFGYPPWLGGNSAAAKAMKDILDGDPRTVILVAWEHINIQFLVEDLGVDKSLVPAWDDSNFDSIYELTFEASSMSKFRIRAENFTASRFLPNEIGIFA